MHFGYDFEMAANSVLPELVVNVRERCKEFIVELLVQVQTRLPENIQVLFMLKNLTPSVALAVSKPRIDCLAAYFSNIVSDMDIINAEWNSLNFVHWPEHCLANTVCFWSFVAEAKNADGNQRFGNVSRLALALLTLPFSNATVERAFSLMNVVHCKLRNRLHVRSVEAILQIRYGLWAANATSSSFEPTEYMLKHFFDKPADNDEDSGAAEDCIVGLECY